MNANNDWEKAKQAVDDAMGAVYDALHHLNEKVDDLMQTPVVDEKKEEVCRKAEETVQNVTSAVEQFGQKLNETLSSPEFAEKTENLKKQAGQAVSQAADYLAKGAALVATGLDKAMQALKGALTPKEENKQETEDAQGEVQEETQNETKEADAPADSRDADESHDSSPEN